jgi:hypothetical protein
MLSNAHDDRLTLLIRRSVSRSRVTLASNLTAHYVAFAFGQVPSLGHACR